MQNSIVLVGGLKGDPARSDLLAALEALDSTIEWGWIRTVRSEQYGLSQKDTNKHFGRLHAKIIEASRANRTVRVVKLYSLHGRLQHKLYAIYPDPVLTPKELGGVEDLVSWIRSPEAGLLPTREWYANTSEAALVAILCKLLRNKSWNADVHGHAWTKEHDLLGQSPVRRPGHDMILSKAQALLGRLKDCLLLSKGGSRTPREWCISTSALPLVKRMIMSCSLDEMSQDGPVRTVILSLMEDDDRPHQLMREIVSQRVRAICAG